MNDHNNPLDKSFRDKLINHEIQPDDHVWDGIQSAMNKNSRRVWLILAPILLLLAAFIFYLIADINPTTPAETKDERTSTNIISNENLTEEPKATILPASGQNELNSSNNENTRITDQEALNSSDPANQNTSTAAKGSETKNDKLSRSAKEGPANNRSKLSNNQGANESRSGTEKRSVQNESLNNSSVKDRSTSVSGIGIENDKTSSSEASTAANTSSPSSLSQEMTTANKISTRSFLKGTSTLDHANEGFQRFTVNHFRSTEKDHKRALTEIDLCALLNPKTNECPTFKDLNRRFQLDVYGLVGKKFTGLSTNDNIPGLGNYLEKRRRSETPLWNVGVGIRLSNQWTNGVSVRGGLQLSRGQIRLNYLDESQRTTVVNVSVDTIVDEMGNTTVVWDTISIVETNIIPVEEYNSFTQLDIPVTLGYTFLGRNFDVELNAGIMFNVLFTKEGHILGPEEDEINSIDPSEQGAVNAYREDLGLSLITSAALNYHMTDQISIFVEPQLRYFLKPVSPELYSLRESWFHMNLLLGTRYSF